MSYNNPYGQPPVYQGYQYEAPPPGFPGSLVAPGAYDPNAPQVVYAAAPAGYPAPYGQPQVVYAAAPGAPVAAYPYGAPPPQQVPYGVAPQQVPYGAPPHQVPYGAPPQQPYGAAPPAGYPYAAQPQQPYAAAPPQPYAPPAAAPGAPGPYATAPAAAAPAPAAPAAAPAPAAAAPAFTGSFTLPTGEARGDLDTVRAAIEASEASYTAQHVERDVVAIHNAISRLFTDRKELINAMGPKTPGQMDKLISAYVSSYGKPLAEELKKNTNGNFANVCYAIGQNSYDYDAYWIHKAIAGAGTDEETLIEILVGRSNNEIRKIRESYQRIYGKDLIKAVTGDTSGHFRRLLVIMLEGNRPEGQTHANPEADAEAIYKAGEGRLGTDESEFIRILCTRPPAHVRAMDRAYAAKHGHNITKAIEKEFSGDLRRALIALIGSLLDRPRFVADAFEKSMKGMGTDDDMLIRLTVRNRHPLIIGPIKEAYLAKYNKTLGHRISSDTSGEYRHLLLALIGDSA